MLKSLAYTSALGVALIGAASAAAVANSPIVARQDDAPCASQFHLMIAGGCALPCNEDLPGLLSTLIGNITAAFPGSDQYFVPYDNSQFQAVEASTIMQQATRDYSARCPNTPIVYLGYSLGGIIVMNTLCGGIPYDTNVLAAIAYGEETFTYPQSYDVGTCQASAPKYPRTNTQQCQPFAPAIQSYCDAGDPQCCGTGQFYLDHFIYPSAYDLAALAFIEQRYAAINGSTATYSASASSVLASVSSTASAFATIGAVPYSNMTSTAAAVAAVPTPATSGLPVPASVLPEATILYTSTLIPLASVGIPASLASLSAVVATNTEIITSIVTASVAGSTATETLEAGVSPTAPYAVGPAFTYTIAASGAAAPSGLVPYMPSSSLTPATGAASTTGVSSVLGGAVALLACLAFL